MYKDKKIVAIVPARGGSKGLSRKNIKVLNGKPLIGWTLEQAQKSKFFDEIFVSTDSEEIAEVSREFGVEVPILRPEELAQDTTPSVDVIAYIIDCLEKKKRFYDYFILLEPTSPLRAERDLDNIIELAVKNSEYDGVISVGEVHTEHPTIVKKIGQSGKILPYLENRKEVYLRQLHDQAYFPYGVGYLLKTNVFKEKKTIYTDNILPYYIRRWQNYEIDDIYDFICIESIFRFQSERGEL